MLFFFVDTAPTEIYTLSLHDALPIYLLAQRECLGYGCPCPLGPQPRSEEHTSELQSQSNLVCRLLLEKKKIVVRPRLRMLHEDVVYERVDAAPAGVRAQPVDDVVVPA